jgi:hypothetical protein
LVRLPTNPLYFGFFTAPVGPYFRSDPFLISLVVILSISPYPPNSRQPQFIFAVLQLFQRFFESTGSFIALTIINLQLTRRPSHSPPQISLPTMASYLPVLLGSVSAIPDDTAVSDLPRGQVDYLSHEWREEDVWRSWRSMTRLKNEITNGIRLENASWRTWWKQRNKLSTVSPETLNW